MLAVVTCVSAPLVHQQVSHPQCQHLFFFRLRVGLVIPRYGTAVMLSFDIQSSYYFKDSNLTIISDPRVGSRFISINNNHDFVIVYQPVNEATNLKEFTTRKKYLNWWSRRDLNPYALRQKLLRLSCLPFHHPTIFQKNKHNYTHYIVLVNYKLSNLV